MDIATFGGGCFWGVEDVFLKIPGVTYTEVGYSGGHTKNPTYKEVCNGNTGHAEVIRIKYDSTKVSYDKLLEIFWKIHDPTTLNRQGPDIGSQYRSVIFFHTPEQEKFAIASKEKLDNSKQHKNKIVTEIKPAAEFYKAEEYHQQYFKKNGLPSCHY